MSEAGVHVAAEGAILWITIDRPRALNALDPAAHRAMHDAFDRLETEAALRVAVVTGAGERAFCVGSDLKARAAANADDHPPTGFAGLTHRFGRSKPIIAAVNGLALGGGVEIVAACDLAIAAEHASFALPEPRVGLAALDRFVRPVTYQSVPEAALPPALVEANPWRLRRRIDGVWTDAPRPAD